MELLADKELIENVKRLVNNEEDRSINNKDIVQQGGYVFGLIPREDFSQLLLKQ